jgi:hypothetical protein
LNDRDSLHGAWNQWSRIKRTTNNPFDTQLEVVVASRNCAVKWESGHVGGVLKGEVHKKN